MIILKALLNWHGSLLTLNSDIQQIKQGDRHPVLHHPYAMPMPPSPQYFIPTPPLPSPSGDRIGDVAIIVRPAPFSPRGSRDRAQVVSVSPWRTIGQMQ
jgi:hypothetical protein